RQVRAYYARKGFVTPPKKGTTRSQVPTFKACKIDSEYGIEVKGFDRAIIEMNEIQEAILLGE
ncbi:MAG: hypothetical protein P9M15_02560, partial [Candidatus Electryoneaceae bacterium]|nr:hypothetical protein [Candidatus Electryoneaceae bacterium]